MSNNKSPISRIESPRDFFKLLGMETDDDLTRYLEKNHPLKIQAYDNIRGYEDGADPFIDFTPHPQFTLSEDSKKRGLRWDDIDADTWFEPVSLNFPIEIGEDDMDVWDILWGVLDEVEYDHKESGRMNHEYPH